jgi:hypothetical protein
MDRDVITGAMRQLASDLADCAWHARHADLTSMSELDLGYRLVVASSR